VSSSTTHELHSLLSFTMLIYFPASAIVLLFAWVHDGVHSSLYWHCRAVGDKEDTLQVSYICIIERSYAFIYCLGKGVHFTIMSCKPELVLVRKGRSVLYCMPSGAGGILHHESRDEEVLNHDGLHWGMSQKIRTTGFMVGNFEPLLFVSHLSICFVQKAFQRLPASVRICQAEASRKAR